ncbi:Rrf2-linked NADH-flavin reductase [Streptococcus oralis]|uniref:Rrf2-linked NADH-flavin reductase n=1 Tax=Streptococcus oralis TaxID=1303 RepID=A0A139M9Z4_STROR|nr:NAD(P)-dependent oxidoreductase [Streptococcus oralis]KXT60568.1 Rrf2-linked NADH-flavin reductase [Streptococcus oralis]
MKIAVVAANGAAGQLIVKEALERGHEVTAIVRSENKSQAEKVLVKDLFDLTKEDVADFDVLVSAFGAFTPETLPLHSKSVEHFNDLLAGSDTRLVIVGGAGSLYVDETKTMRLLDTPDFPDEFKPLASAQADELDLIRQKNNLKWTFVSPAADFDPEAPKTGNYVLAGEIFTVNDKGDSFISYSDYAVAMLDIIESGEYEQERISVRGK